jgi:hypothetical protein
MILSKKDKKIKKDIVAMVVKDLKSKAGQRKPKENNSEDEGDDDLYNLVRGGNKSSLVIQRLKDEEDFVPTRNLRERVIMMISSDESDSSNYIPKKRKIEKEEEIKEIKNDEETGSDRFFPNPKDKGKEGNVFNMAFIPNTNAQGKEGAGKSNEPMDQEKGQGESKPMLRPRATWTTKGDSRSDKEADAEWHKANALLFGPSYEAWHKKDKLHEKVKTLERKLADEDWQDDEERRKRNKDLLESTLENITDSSDRLAIKILLLEDELKQNDRLKRQRASRTAVIRQRKADKRLRQKKERERGIPSNKAPYEPPVELETMKGLREKEPQKQDNDHDKSMSKLREEIKDLEERKRIESAVLAFKKGAQGESMGSEDSDSSSEEESSSSSSSSSGKTSWDGDPNTPHPENPYSKKGEKEYARQRMLDRHNASEDEIRPPPWDKKSKKELKIASPGEIRRWSKPQKEEQESSSVLPTPPDYCSVEETKRKQQK